MARTYEVVTVQTITRKTTVKAQSKADAESKAKEIIAQDLKYTTDATAHSLTTSSVTDLTTKAAKLKKAS